MKKRCAKCGKMKDVSEFSKQKATKDELQSWCKECILNYQKAWRIRNKKSIKKSNRKWHQKNTVTTGPRTIKGKKRKRPKDGICELCDKKCDKEKKILGYHHWDDDDMLKGIWLCYKCHMLIEHEEEYKALLLKWHPLKAEIDKEAETIKNKRDTDLLSFSSFHSKMEKRNLQN